MGVTYTACHLTVPGTAHTEKDPVPVLRGETCGFSGGPEPEASSSGGVGVGARSSNVVGTFLCIDVLLEEGS